MTIAIAVVSVLLVAGVSVGLFLWARGRSEAEAAQFVRSTVGGVELQVALPSGWFFGFDEAIHLAVGSCFNVFGRETSVGALNGSRIIVHSVNSWTDPLTGREVGGTSRYGEIHVGADLSALFHELAHRVIEVRHGVIDEEHVYFTEAVRAADERYRAAVKGVSA